jgi:hypothetical protein
MLSPMFDHCHFIPSDFPQFDTRNNNNSHNDNMANGQSIMDLSSTRTSLNVCVSGSGRNHRMLAQALQKLQPKHIVLRIYQRIGELPLEYQNLTFAHSSRLQIIRESDFYKFQQSMAQCHVMLPMLDPQHSRAYFPRPGTRRLSGSIAQAIGYRIPLALHDTLSLFYARHLTAPHVTYTNQGSFTQALHSLLHLIRLGNTTTTTTTTGNVSSSSLILPNVTLITSLSS